MEDLSRPRPSRSKRAPVACASNAQHSKSSNWATLSCRHRHTPACKANPLVSKPVLLELQKVYLLYAAVLQDLEIDQRITMLTARHITAMQSSDMYRPR